MARLASDEGFFDFLARSASRRDLRIVIADGRLGLAREDDASFGLVILDAFTSDAIPTHLLTREAIGLDLRKLAPQGLLAFHVSNNFFDFRPVLARAADDLGLAALSRSDDVLPAEERETGRSSSVWVVLARSRDDLGGLAARAGWTELRSKPGDPRWTDDWSWLLGVLAR